jgi:uracil-DNA glycosylase family 4
MSRIFINYRRADSEGYVGRLYDKLTQHFRAEDIFMDVDAIKPGEDFVSKLEDAVSACDVLLAVIGPQWAGIADEQGNRRLDAWNDLVRLEIAAALTRDKLVIPVLVGRARMPPPGDLPDDLKLLARRNAFELSHQRFAADVETLVQRIKAALPANPTLKKKSAQDSDVLKQKKAALREVRNDLINATDSPLYALRLEQRLFPVFGDGHPDATLVFIGEAPGKNEVVEGRPFVGASGEVLDDMLASINLGRQDVFVTNLLLDFAADRAADGTLQKRDPLPHELAYYQTFIDRMLDIIRPAVIVTLGRFAMQYVLRKYDLPEKTELITRNHGKILSAMAPYGEISIVPMFHPAMVLYKPEDKAILRQDFQKLRPFVS